MGKNREVTFRAPAELIRMSELLALGQKCRLSTFITEALKRYVAETIGQMQPKSPEPEAFPPFTCRGDDKGPPETPNP